MSYYLSFRNEFPGGHHGLRCRDKDFKHIHLKKAIYDPSTKQAIIETIDGEVLNLENPNVDLIYSFTGGSHYLRKEDHRDNLDFGTEGSLTLPGTPISWKEVKDGSYTKIWHMENFLDERYLNGELKSDTYIEEDLYMYCPRRATVRFSDES